MIGYVLIENQSKILFFKQRNVQIEFLNETIHFVKDERQYLYVENPYFRVLRAVPIQCDHSFILEHVQSKKIVQFYFVDGMENYASFQKYAIEKEVYTIGPAVYDALQVNYPNAQDIHIKIDFVKQLIYQEQSSIVATLNDNVFYATPFQTGDVLRILGLQIIFHECFLMINGAANFEIHLNSYKANEQKFPLPRENHIPILINPIYEKYPLLPEFELPEPRSKIEWNQNPLLLNIGPALTMSIATMASGFLMVYNGYLHGRTVIEMLPMILLPSVMFVSTLVWNPLQRLHYKRMDYKKRKERVNEYRVCLNALQEQIDTILETYKKELNHFLPENKHQVKQNHLAKIYHIDKESDYYLNLRYGVFVKRNCIVLKNGFKTNENDEIHYLRNQFIQANMQQDAIPTIVDLKKLRGISLIADDNMLFQDTLFQLAYRHNPNQLKLIIYASKVWLDHNPYVYQLPHLQFETFLIATNEKELNLILHTFPYDALDCVLFTFKPISHLMHREDIIVIESCKELRYATQRVILSKEASTYTLSLDGKKEEILYETMDLIPFFRYFQIYPIAIQQKYHPDKISFFDIHDITHHEIPVLNNWRINSTISEIVAPIGLDEEGNPITIDIHENGDGPHGLIAGMTGSGKSELIQTLLLSLCIRYHPEELNIVLIDFKGGGISQIFEHDGNTIPHFTGVMSNLDEGDIHRILVSLQNECLRREKLFQQLHQMSHRPILNMTDYQKNVLPFKELPKLAHLIIVVDEFAELKKEYPEFLKSLISIARIGRSLGIHLLLSTQKPSGVVDDQIWANCRFKICLKVQDKIDSKEVLHIEDAAYIKQPGEFYFLCDYYLQHGKSGYTGAPVSPNTKQIEILNYAGQAKVTNQEDITKGMKQFDACIKSIQEACKKEDIQTYPIWLKPLTKQLITANKRTSILELGIIDDYYHHRQSPYTFVPITDVSLLIVGEQTKEKKAFLQTLMYTLLNYDNDFSYIVIDDGQYLVGSNIENDKRCVIYTDAEAHYEMDEIFTYLRTPAKEMRFLIITDINLYLSAEDRNKQELLHVLNRLEQRNIRIIAFANAIENFPHQLLPYFKKRIGLSLLNRQDIYTLFNDNSYKTFNKAGFGLVQQGPIMEMCFYECRDSLPLKRGKHSCKIPHIPKGYIDISKIDSEIPIGYLIHAHTWYSVTNRPTYVVGIETDLYTLNHMILQRITKMNESCQELIHIMDIKEFEKMPSLPEDMVVILFGNVMYQYVYSLSLKRSLQENQGYFIDGNQHDIIQIMEVL